MTLGLSKSPSTVKTNCLDKNLHTGTFSRGNMIQLVHMAAVPSIIMIHIY